MSLLDDRRKWNQRYGETLALGAAKPEPHPLALRWASRMTGGRMLDAACGLGRGVAAVGQRFDSVYAVDLSELALGAARRMWEGRPVRWIAADVTALAWPEDFFALVCAFAFTDLPFFRRLRSSIRPGGMFLYEGFSRRQLELRPEMNPAWTATEAEVAGVFAGWTILEKGETAEPPFRTWIAATRPAPLER